MDLEFPRGRGDQVKKSWKFQGLGGSNLKPSGTENPGGVGAQTVNNPPWGGAVWIFSGTTHCNNMLLSCSDCTNNCQITEWP